ncbi:hypothetical protein ACLOJK_009193 [Asimina triloba]
MRLRLPSSLRDHIKKPKVAAHRGLGDSSTPSITIFSAPSPFAGEVGAKQVFAIRSWLSLSPNVVVVLFGQDPSIVQFGASIGSRTILLPDFISLLYTAHKLHHDWLLVTRPQSVSRFPFRLDNNSQHWLQEVGEQTRLEKEFLFQNQQWSYCNSKIVFAWNTGELPLHAGVLPPFLYGKGLHDHWIINEALSSSFRFVFDASETLSSVYPEGIKFWPDQFSKDAEFGKDDRGRLWEAEGNSQLAVLYGSLYLRPTNILKNLVKLAKCNDEYLLINLAKEIVYDTSQKQGIQNSHLLPASGQVQWLSGLFWKTRILPSSRLKNRRACIESIYSRDRMMNPSSMKLPRDAFKVPKELSFPFSLESLLHTVADENRTVILAVAGNSYRDMLMSWVCRLRRLSISNFIICALDPETFHFAVLQGLPVFKDPLAPSKISFNDCHFGTKCFQRVTKVKSRLVLQILQMGYDVLLSDVDVYWFSNPLPLLRSFGPAVLVAQSDEFKEKGPINLPRRLNSGFYYAPSDRATIAAMSKVVQHASSSDLSEQPSFYDVLCGTKGVNRVSNDRCMEPETNLTVHFLDRNRFPNGAYKGLWQKRNVTAACKKKGCIVLHNNWISGRKRKLDRQPERTKQLDKDRPSKDTMSKESSVRIIHAGGVVELYELAIRAADVMYKYPKMLIARPEVFQRPHDSIVRQDEVLIPGQKFYLVPQTTIKKLKKKHAQKLTVAGERKTVDGGDDFSDETVCSADYHVRNEPRPRSPQKKSGGNQEEEKKVFKPPIKRPRVRHAMTWEPSLDSVEELSP